MKKSTAVMRPSLRTPIRTRAASAGRARPKKYSSSRLTRIITGCPVFLASNAGIAIVCVPGILLPKPPPVYSLMMTTACGSTPTHPATDSTVCATLCVEQCRKSFPLRQ
jgi:hypothetical protein